MPLLGLPLLITLGLLTLTVAAATIWLWPRTGRSRAHHVAARGALLGLNQALAVLLVAAALNNYGYFYGSWSDLLGRTSGPHVVQHIVDGSRRPSHDVQRASMTAHPAVAAGPDWSTPAEYARKGRVETIQVTGVRSGLSNPVMVYLPPQYFQARYAGTRFPAAEVFTGYPGMTRALVDRMHYPDALLREVRSGRAQPMVLVMLRPTVAPPRDTECTDVPGGPLALTYLAADVPTAIAQHVRVRPVGWGAIGDSTGGYCAAKLAMTHSDVFSSAVSLSGYFHTLHDSTTGDLWGGSPVLRHLNDLEWLLAHQPAPPVSVLATISQQERGHNGVQDTRRFVSMVRPPMSVDLIVQPHGGHNFATWAQDLPTAIDWLSRHLRA